MNWIDTMRGQSLGNLLHLMQASPASMAKLILNAPKRVIKFVFRMVVNWHYDRVERAELLGLSEHMLKDMGISRGQAVQMAHDRWFRRDIRKNR